MLDDPTLFDLDDAIGVEEVERCWVCGSALPDRQGKGRPARYCTKRCKSRARSLREAGIALAYQSDSRRTRAGRTTPLLTCFTCGVTFSGNAGGPGRNKRYCSDACRVAGKQSLNRHRQYRITSAQYDELLMLQNGRCAICRQMEQALTPEGTVKPLAIDHCHESGMVRGLLCHNCNVAIGMMQDDSDRLRSAAEYLDKAYIGEWV